MAAATVLNLPVPREQRQRNGRDPRAADPARRRRAFAPEAIVLQCGADAVEEDPLSRLSLSNNAHWACCAG
jgi:acetoin utilization protein AcuC